MNQPPNQPPNTPPGYPQQPGGQYPQQPAGNYGQQPGGPPPAGAPYPPQGPYPGMAPPYYQPQPKKGFPVWAIVLIVIVCMLPVCGIFGLAAIPLITTNTRDARRSEGEQLLGSMKMRVKVAHARLNVVPPQFTGAIGEGGCGVNPTDLEGKYYRVRDSIEGNKDRARIMCDPTGQGGADGTGQLDFSITNPTTDLITWK
jgi:hypothetical protein